MAAQEKKVRRGVLLKSVFPAESGEKFTRRSASREPRSCFVTVLCGAVINDVASGDSRSRKFAKLVTTWRRPTGATIMTRIVRVSKCESVFQKDLRRSRLLTEVHGGSLVSGR